MAVRERIPGGLASGMSPADFDAKQLAKGALHEVEHTSDFMVAVEIAMDHLAEDPIYYDRLEKMERKRKRPGTKRSRKPKVTSRRRGGSSRRINQLVRDQFRDIYDG